MTGAAKSFDNRLVAPVGRGNVSSTHGGTCDASLGVGGARGDGAAPAGRDGDVHDRGCVSGGLDVGARTTEAALFANEGRHAASDGSLLHTTRALLRQHDACTAGYRKLMAHLGGAAAWPEDRPIPLLTVLESNGAADAIWCLRAVLPDEEAARDRIARLFAADCAAAVLPIFERARPGDARPREAIEAARQFARGNLDAKTLREKRAAADDAAYAAYAAAYAAAAAADAAYAARKAERDAQTRDLLELLGVSA